MPRTIRSQPVRYGNAFPELADATLRQVVASNARLYRKTYTHWADWCAKQLVDHPAHVFVFWGAQSVAKSTHQRQLSWRQRIGSRFVGDPLPQIDGSQHLILCDN